jgi:hypothetical protein
VATDVDGGDMSRIRGWLESLSAEGPVRLALYVFVLVSIVVIAISFRLYSREFFEGILVEAHGMLFDLLVIGVFVLWLNKLGERRLTVQRYRDEIEDFLGWESDEAMHRIVGNIKRLNREGVTSIWLGKAYLRGANLRGANLSRANLTDANLSEADLTEAKLTGANLYRANLRGAELLGINLEGADLSGADLSEASLDWANLDGANLYTANLSGAVGALGSYTAETKWPEGFTQPGAWRSLRPGGRPLGHPED